MSPAIVGLVGASNSGKTTLIERLLPVLRARGHRVGTLKHDAHHFEMDRPGKDTWRHRQAGAEAVLIAGGGQLALIRDHVEESSDPVELVRAYLGHLDLVLVEGFKRAGIPRLEIVRGANTQHPITPLAELQGLVTDLPLQGLGVPVYGLEDVEAIADRIEALAGFEARA